MAASEPATRGGSSRSRTARRVVTSVLTPRVVGTFADAFRIRAGEIVESVFARGDVDAVAEIAEAFPLSVFTDAVGLDPDMSLEERRKLLRLRANGEQQFRPAESGVHGCPAGGRRGL